MKTVRLVLTALALSGAACLHVRDEGPRDLFGEPLGRPPMDAAQEARLTRALQRAEEAWRADPTNVDKLIWYGRHLAYLGRIEEAIDVYSSGLESHPDDPRLLRHRGHRLISLRRFDAAVRDLERAADRVRGRPDRVERDGLPNARGIPRSTLKSNIFYHLGLAYYFLGEFAAAEGAFVQELAEADLNDDILVSAAFWLALSAERQGRVEEAQAALLPIHAGLDVIENRDYLDLCLMLRGQRDPGALWRTAEGAPPVRFATLGHGVGAFEALRGDLDRALDIFQAVASCENPYAFGCIAAEVELARCAVE